MATKILNEDSAADWAVKQNTGKGEHTASCQNQVPLNKQPRMDDAVEELAVEEPHEIKAYNQQWCRFGSGGALARGFGYTQTRAAIIKQSCQMKHTENAWGIPTLGGVRLLEKFSDSKTEKESRNYYLSKEHKLSAGLVYPKLLKISDTCPETFSAIEMDYIRLDKRTKNMIPIYHLKF